MATEDGQLASTPKVVLGCIAFAFFWLMAVFPSLRLLPIGRTAGALLSAALMVVFQVLSPTSAFAAIDLPTLCLLFSTMIISVFLERARFFLYLGYLLEWKGRGGADLLCRICAVTSITAALLTNDTVCVMLTPFVLNLVRRRCLPPQPFLVALASSANIGSALTPIGNPQNLIISGLSGVGFGTFIVGLLPAVVVTSAINCILLLALYWRRLKAPEPAQPDQELITCQENPSNADSADPQNTAPQAQPALQTSNSWPQVRLGARQQDHLSSHVVTPRACGLEQAKEPPSDLAGIKVEVPISHDLEASTKGLRSRHRGDAEGEAQGIQSLGDRIDHVLEAPVALPGGPSIDGRVWPGRNGTVIRSLNWAIRDLFFRAAVYLVVVGMLACLLTGLNLPWTALTSALIIICLDFKDAEHALSQVSYSLLVFFAGLFISVSGFNATGVPGRLWQWLEPHCHLTSAGGTALLTVVITALSNVASNVPTVLLLGPRIAASDGGSSVTHAWLVLAFVSTIAGNLTLVGSAANLIVSEAAYRAKDGLDYKLSFWNHLRFGFPSTCVMLAIGVPLIGGK